MSFHDWLFSAHSLILADATNSTQIKVALIGAGALIFGGIVQQILSRKEKEPLAWKKAREAQHDLVVDLRKQLIEEKREHAKLQATFDNAMIGMTLRDQEAQRLRDLLWAHGINPNPPVSLVHPASPVIEGAPPEGTLSP